MAHKQQLPCFERLKAVCEDQDEPLDYTLCVSVGIHEDQPWSESFQESERRLRELFGNRLRFLGFLADDALARDGRGHTGRGDGVGQVCCQDRGRERGVCRDRPSDGVDLRVLVAGVAQVLT